MSADIPLFAVAHIRVDANGVLQEHPLHEHLQSTAAQAAQFAATFGAADWGHCAGLWHDLGKYDPDWQEYLRGYYENGEGQDG